MDFREKILKEGVLKHRQTSYALPRWKTRYVVFKISGGGRLQFIIYKESPATPANEVKEIPIEEFGGVDSTTGKVDSERNVFSVITTNMTDSFSTDSADDLVEWTQLLQEYLGKELTFGIVIPQKQGQLKSGRGILRIRNTGFTITTCDNPPRCMGTWQIIHIRKFGGSDSFKFQTGSKCPTGELLYVIQTDDNARVKALFNDLSQHKPIFSDDRVGRRMTLERNRNHHGPLRQAPSRFSLQSTQGREGHDSPVPGPIPGPMYENKEAITEVAQRLGKRGCPPPLPANRRHDSSTDDRINSPHIYQSPRPSCVSSHPSSVSSHPSSVSSPLLSPTKMEEQRMYQNIPGLPAVVGSAPHSPTKLRNRYPVPQSEPVPEGYYNVSPPRALKKYSGSSPPRHSPEEDHTFFSEFAPVPPPPIKTVSSATSHDVYTDAYLRFNPLQRPTMKIEGENLVVQRPPNIPLGVQGAEGEVRTGAKDETVTYQNLDFMNKKSSTGIITNANIYAEDTDSGGGMVARSVGQPLPIIPDLHTEIHSYTNINFALEAAQGRPLTSRGGAVGSSNQPHAARTGDVKRKISAPPLSRDRLGAMSYKDLFTPTSTPSTTTAAVTSNLSLSLHPKLKASLSSHDLQQSPETPVASKSDLLPEYYNLFVPRLPANQEGGGGGERGKSLEPRSRSVQATLSDFLTRPGVSYKMPSSNKQQLTKQWENGSEMAATATKLPSCPGGKEQSESFHPAEEREDGDKLFVDPTGNVAGPDEGNGNQTLSASRYDHLELIQSDSGTRTTRFSPAPSHSPENLSRGNTPCPTSYDQLELKEPSPPSNNDNKKDEIETEISSNTTPLPRLHTSFPAKIPLPYERKVNILGHSHTYDYIDVKLKDSQQEQSVGHASGPEISVTPRHNSDPGRPDSGTITALTSDDNELPSQWIGGHYSLHDDNDSRLPSTKSRRKPLPLQSVPLDESFDADTTLQEGSKGQIDEQRYDKPLPKPRKSANLSTSSDFTSSFESDKSQQSPVARQRLRSPVLRQSPPNAPLNQMSPMLRSGSHSPSPLPPAVPLKQGGNMNSVDSQANSNGSISHNYSTVTDNGYRTTSLTREVSPAVPLRPKDVSGFTVSLPVTEIQFDKPLVPPKPRVLDKPAAPPTGVPVQYTTVPGVQYTTAPGVQYTTAPGIQYTTAPGVQHTAALGVNDSGYTTMQLPQNEVLNYTRVVPKQQGGPVVQSYRDTGKVVYQSINFEVTEGLRKTREDVEMQRNREIEWLQEQREQSLKTLAAK